MTPAFSILGQRAKRAAMMHTEQAVISPIGRSIPSEPKLIPSGAWLVKTRLYDGPAAKDLPAVGKTNKAIRFCPLFLNVLRSLLAVILAGQDGAGAGKRPDIAGITSLN